MSSEINKNIHWYVENEKKQKQKNKQKPNKTNEKKIIEPVLTLRHWNIDDIQYKLNKRKQLFVNISHNIIKVIHLWSESTWNVISD